MYVKDKMTVNVVTVKKEYAVPSAIDIMHTNKLHRLPVVDDAGKIVGLLTKKAITSCTPSDSSSLSVFELNYLLNKFKVGDIMCKEPVTIGPDALLEEAAAKMVGESVGCLPVVKDDGTLVGIITDKDILGQFADLLGYNQDGTRYVILIKEDKAGILNAISKCFMDKNISISHLAVYNTVRGIEVVVIATGDNSADCKDALKEAGWNVTSTKKLKSKK